MSKIMEYLKHDQIQTALCLGFCIILMAFVVKRLLHQQLGNIEEATPGFIMLFYEIAVKNKKLDYKYKRPALWNSLMIISTLIVIYLKTI